MSETIYISFSKNTEVNDRKVTIGSAASVWCSDKHILARVKAINIVNVPDVRSRRYVISFMKIIKLIKTECDNVEVNNVGEPEFIISYKKARSKNHMIQFIKIAIVAALVFFGGTFAIMAYSNDVDINSIFENICSYIKTDNDNSMLIIQIAYSIGLTAGIVIFYNHLGKKQEKKDPTPLEIEMRTYEEDVNTAIINGSAREEKEMDVN